MGRPTKTSIPTDAEWNANAFGDSLADWQALWLAWFIGDVDIPPDDNGNADVGHVVLLPIPGAAGDGTPASTDVTLDAGQAFAVPLWSTYGFSYSDGAPDGPLVPLDVFKTLDLTLTIDGKTVIDHRNLMDYYSETLYPDPGLPLSFLPGDAVSSCNASASPTRRFRRASTRWHWTR